MVFVSNLVETVEKGHFKNLLMVPFFRGMRG
jgi:hypothetical protein